MSSADRVFEALKRAYRPPAYDTVGWRSDLWDLAQWVAYCTRCEPVPLSVFQGMQGEHANRKRWMPAFDDETVSRSVHGMPECELKAGLVDWLRRNEEQR